MAHDLNAILSEVLTHFAPLPPIYIAWNKSKEFKRDKHKNKHQDIWAQALWTKDGRFIGISNRAKRAPRWVVKYLIFHETLHFSLLPRDSRDESKWRNRSEPYKVTWHHHAFRIAVRMWPDYERAEKWLTDHTY